MKVKLSHPYTTKGDGVEHQPGDVIEVDDSVGRALLKSHAVRADETPGRGSTRRPGPPEVDATS